jgi:hypothetical protein
MAKAKAKASAKRSSEPRSLNVLFIGNSFTQRNDLPGLIARLASAADRTLEHRLISAGGASLRRHRNAGAAADAIKGGAFDFVVLQEQSTLPIKSPARMHESVRLFDQIIKAAGARTALYLTWARRHAPETQAAITDAYTSIGEELGATVIPAGVAWQRFCKAHNTPELYDDDGSHPSLAGSYLAACVAFAALFGVSPVGNTADVEGLTPAERALLQRAAEA